MSVLAALERLDHKLTGRPETEYVYESRKWRMRLAVAVLLTFVSLTIALTSNVAVAGWLLVLASIATGVKIVLARRAWQAATVTAPSARWFEQ